MTPHSNKAGKMTRRSIDHIDLQATTSMLEIALFESVMFCRVGDSDQGPTDDGKDGEHYGAWWEMDPLKDLKLD